MVHSNTFPFSQLEARPASDYSCIADHELIVKVQLSSYNGLLAYLDAALDICQYQMPTISYSFSRSGSLLFAIICSVNDVIASVAVFLRVLRLIDLAACTPNAKAFLFFLLPGTKHVRGSFGIHNSRHAQGIRALDH